MQVAARLAAALAIGLLIGLERGWQERDQPEGGRVAGLRTFALIGLLGGVLALADGSPVALSAGLVGLAVLFAVSFGRAASALGSVSITTAVAALVTFGLGALAARGNVLLAAGAAAVVALLLGLKRELHGGIRRIAPAELNAVLQLAVLTAAVLPLLPDAGYGPYAAWNPFRLWIAVLLVASLSLAGHVAARWRGDQQGLLWTGVLGGLVSSTAATLSLARSVAQDASATGAAAAGAVAASGVMFLRMAVVTAILQPRLAVAIGGLLVWLAAASFAVAAWRWRRSPPRTGQQRSDRPRLRVFDLQAALGFALLLAAIAVAVRFAREHLGAAGLYGAAFLSGLADVNAILISTLQLQAQGELTVAVAATAIALAVLANMASKAALAGFVGGRGFGGRSSAASSWSAQPASRAWPRPVSRAEAAPAWA